jgi:hypothetical protein
MYYSIDYLVNSKNKNNALFIWGDSQIYHGLNFSKIEESTGKRVFSAARRGAGVYDFLVFSQEVPKESDVIIAFSKPMQLRDKKSDMNTSKISYSALKNLYNSNYDLKLIYNIIKKNKKPIKIFRQDDNLYPYADSLVYSEPIELFESLYSREISLLNDKQTLYKKGVENLIKKDCKISFIKYPLHTILFEIENNSKTKYYLDNFEYQILDLFESPKIDSITIDDSGRIMYDLTHLNKRGANVITEIIIDRTRNSSGTTKYIINGGFSK